MKRISHKIIRKVSALNLNRIIRLVFSVAPRLSLFTVAVIILESALWLLTTYCAKSTIDTIGKLSMNGIRNDHVFIQSLFTVVLVALVYAIVKSLSGFLSEYHAARVSDYIDDRIHQKAVALDLAFYESPEYFDVLRRAKEAGPDRPAAIISDLVDLGKNTVMLLAVMIILMQINVWLLPLLVVFAVPLVWVRVRVARKLHQLRMQQTPAERKATYFSYLLTSDTTAKEVRAFGLGAHIRGAYMELRQSLLKRRTAIKRNNMLVELISSVCSVIGVFTCIALIAWDALHGKSTIGDLTIFLVVFLQAFTIIHGISSGIGKVYQNSIIVKSIFELLETENEPLPAAATANDTAGAADPVLLEVSGLSFTYPGAEHTTLEHISLQLRKGQVIALAGLNGSGKSTLIKLLCRLYQPDQGQISYCGQNINNYTDEEYRAIVSPVFQDFVRYNVTVSDNIRFGRIGTAATDTAIADAARRSGAAPFIADLPRGYDTLMGKIFEEGHEISIGQWQKLAIARGLYGNAQIMILDEATSALDAYAEDLFFSELRQHIGDRAAIIISHRLSAIQKADYIYVLSEGRIRQSGRHEELVAREGDYRLLFQHEKSEEDVRE